MKKKILYIPMYTIQNKKTNQFILNSCENWKVTKHILNSLSDEFDFNVVIPDDTLWTVDDSSEIYNLVQDLSNVSLFKISIPPNNALQRWSFDMVGYTSILEEIKPDIIVNNCDTTTRNLRVACDFVGINPEIFTYYHFIDFPSKNIYKGSNTHYFPNQVESSLYSDRCLFMSKSNEDLFKKERIEYLEEHNIPYKIDEPKFDTVGIVFSEKEIQDKINKITDPIEFERPTIIFPNRLSDNNYAHHKEFITAVNELCDEGLEFDVVITNANEAIPFDVLEETVKPIIFPYGKRILSVNEYYSLLSSSDFVCGLFREVHGGISSREAIMCDCIPIFVERNDYIVLMDIMYNELPKEDRDLLQKLIYIDENDNFTIEDLKQNIRYYIENYSKINRVYNKYKSHIKANLVKFESSEYNVKKIGKMFV